MKFNVNFSAAGFGKVFQKPENISNLVSNKEAILEISKLLPSVVSPPGQPVEFKSVVDLLGIDYVGYIIEKERFNPVTKEWIKTDEYKIVGSKSNVFRDTRVAYGFTYRYRMKTILKVTIKRSLASLVNFSARTDLQKFIDSKIQEKLTANRNQLARIQQESLDGLAVSTSAGDAISRLKISDTVSANLNSDGTFNLVDVVNNQVLDFSAGSMSDEQFLKTFNQQPTLEKESEIEYISFYYESNASKNWSIVDIVKLTPPNYPQTINIYPNSVKKETLISWLKPVSDVEVKFYNIYRRNKIGENWNVLAEGLREFETLFVDEKVLPGQKYIYAISSTDIHGIESFLSTQIQAELNPNIATEKKEKDLVWISGGGVSLNEVDLVIKKFNEIKEQLIARKNITLKPSTKFRDESKVFLIKIISLDTHEKVELKVTLKNQKLQV